VLAVVFVNAFLSLTFEGALQALVPTLAGEGLEGFNGRLQAARLGGALAARRWAASCWPPPPVRRWRP
jgi:hypothetical protein